VKIHLPNNTTGAKPELLPRLDLAQPNPLISVMIPTYNCARYLKETLESVLQQDMGNNLMQIDVIDDCSADNPEKVVAEFGAGRVGFFRQPHNLGHSGNFRTCLLRSRGRLVHLLHGDDKVLQGFYQTVVGLMEQHPEAGAVFARNIVINEEGDKIGEGKFIQPQPGIVKDFLQQSLRRQLMQTPSIVVQRKVYETIGIFHPQLSWTEDWEMWTRIGAHYPVLHSPQLLAAYRVHTASNTGRYMRTAENLKDLERIMEIFAGYLPAHEQKDYKKEFRNNISKAGYHNARMLWKKYNDRNGAFNQLKAGFRNCTHLRQGINLATLGANILLNRKSKLSDEPA
jgi:glycosyltransferase involved in cell wall biosynthesis